MEENVVVLVTLEEGGGIAVQMGSASEQISPMTIVGILEQVKYSIFENMRIEKIDKPVKKYDA